uniref:Uncharacterized protein n=1 Tax=Arundo donax TaxID=35708 RepID=A0A0A8Y5B7_ARUDO
MHLDGNLAG